MRMRAGLDQPIFSFLETNNLGTWYTQQMTTSENSHSVHTLQVAIFILFVAKFQTYWKTDDLVCSDFGQSLCVPESATNGQQIFNTNHKKNTSLYV